VVPARTEIADAMATTYFDVLAPLERSSVREAPAPKEVPASVVLTPKAAAYTRIEAVLGSELPPSARRFAAWWGTVTPASGESSGTEVWVLPAAKPPQS